MRMNARSYRWVTAALMGLALLLSGASPARAQSAAAGTQSPTLVPLKVTVVIGYYEGVTQTMNLPFVLHVNANGDNTSVRMGSLIPLPSGRDDNGNLQFNYQNVGTNIDLDAETAPGDRFVIDITVNDSSMVEAEADADSSVVMRPTMRTFTANNSLLMTDGQTIEYTTAADKATGQTVRVSVTLEVIR